MPKAMGSIMAVVAVFDTHIDKSTVTAPSPASTAPGRPPIDFSERNPSAIRRSSW